MRYSWAASLGAFLVMAGSASAQDGEARGPFHHVAGSDDAVVMSTSGPPAAAVQGEITVWLWYFYRDRKTLSSGTTYDAIARQTRIDCGARTTRAVNFVVYDQGLRVLSRSDANAVARPVGSGTIIEHAVGRLCGPGPAAQTFPALEQARQAALRHFAARPRPPAQ